ncbi:MAG: hypothetical protein KF884_04855 [Fimbriimonadaceae bacterium]|nr:hypothetical protein [Fimbriimonadaceae bacterium]QYK59418.1 MAG: hypothetical protein KF884_04855 [Fimbriimonadaceae bacterium]
MARPADRFGRILRTTSLAVVVLGAATVVGSFLVRDQMRASSDRYQLVRKTSQSELFGDVGEPIGSPQVYVVTDPQAVLPGTGADGVKLLDDDYLRKKGSYPLQMQTVDAIADYARLGGGLAVLAGAGGLLLARRRSAQRSATGSRS